MHFLHMREAIEGFTTFGWGVLLVCIPLLVAVAYSARDGFEEIRALAFVVTAYFLLSATCFILAGYYDAAAALATVSGATAMLTWNHFIRAGYRWYPLFTVFGWLFVMGFVMIASAM